MKVYLGPRYTVYAGVELGVHLETVNGTHSLNLVSYSYSDANYQSSVLKSVAQQKPRPGALHANPCKHLMRRVNEPVHMTTPQLYLLP